MAVLEVGLELPVERRGALAAVHEGRHLVVELEAADVHVGAAHRGAVPVHGMNGIWGTIAIGIFGKSSLGVANDGLIYSGQATQLGVQALGAFAGTGFALISMGVVFLIIRTTVGLRVSRDEELRGLDIGEHGMESYAGFQVFVTE